METTPLVPAPPGGGTRHATIAPHNTYRCAGDDRWIALAAADDAEFARLADASGHPEWASDPRFATVAARKRHERELDAAIAAWTADQDADALETALRAAGVTSARVRD